MTRRSRMPVEVYRRLLHLLSRSPKSRARTTDCLRVVVGRSAAALILLAACGQALSGPVGGLDFTSGPVFTVGEIYHNLPSSVGEELKGYGKVDSINSIPVSSLCADCELTFQFGGYGVVHIDPVTPTARYFTGGWVNYYLGSGADRDFSTLNAGGSAGDIAEATNGTLFLSVTAHPTQANGLFTTLVAVTGLEDNTGTVSPAGFLAGLGDVNTGAGGIANALFDTNGIPAILGGPADLQLGASFTALNPLYPDECSFFGACVRGGVDTRGAIQNVPSGSTPIAPAPPLAQPVDIGGLLLAPGATFQVGQIYQNVFSTVGDQLVAYGKVDSINSIPVERLCNGCELTFVLDQYRQRFYLGFGADNDFTTLNAGGAAGNLAEASNGTLFLTLKGHPFNVGTTMIAAEIDIGSPFPAGWFSGLADVDTSAGGIANSFFDTNTIPSLSGPADFAFSSSVALLPANDPACNFREVCVSGSASFIGGLAGGPAAVLPQPATVVLLVVALIGLGFGRRTTRNSGASDVARRGLPDDPARVTQ
jgi:hypothetical protein